jgi:type III secretion protein C
MKKIKKITWQFACASCLVSMPLVLGAEEEIIISPSDLSIETGHDINFNDVSITEFIRFVTRISKVNFVFNAKELEFNITFATGKTVTSVDVVKALVQMLRVRGFYVVRENNYYVIHKGEKAGSLVDQTESNGLSMNRLTASLDPFFGELEKDKMKFFVYKLKYHQGSEIETALKKIAGDLINRSDTPQKLLKAIQSIQWISATNSLLCSADEETLDSLKKLINSLDVPARQVFIEVLVVETDVRKSMDFGLQWVAGGEYRNKVGFGTGNFPPLNNRNPSNPFAGTVQGVNASNPPTGLSQIPIGNGFDLGVIGDIIMHKGKSYLTLGSLVHALQADGDSTIVLNQKIITQDNKSSTIFVGDNIPFTGSVVQTVGQSQQTTANIEYRDIGVNLNITPMLGEGDIITLDIEEQITESVDDFQNSATMVNGIRTTKTNMVTHVHVPDQHFLVLSGMVRNARSHHKAGIPCLGGLPVIGAAFSRNIQNDEKRNVIIFVRPTIVRTVEDFNQITQKQEEVFREQARPGEFDLALDVLPPSK